MRQRFQVIDHRRMMEMPAIRLILRQRFQVIDHRRLIRMQIIRIREMIVRQRFQNHTRLWRFLLVEVQKSQRTTATIERSSR